MTRMKEPWPEPATIEVATGTVGLSLDDCRRARACVDVCAGTPTDYLIAAGIGHFEEMNRAYNEAIKQRDELLAAAIAWNESRTTASEFVLVDAIAKAINAGYSAKAQVVQP